MRAITVIFTLSLILFTNITAAETDEGILDLDPVVIFEGPAESSCELGVLMAEKVFLNEEVGPTVPREDALAQMARETRFVGLHQNEKCYVYNIIQLSTGNWMLSPDERLTEVLDAAVDMGNIKSYSMSADGTYYVLQ